jgi:hypothetical protein
MLGYPITYAQGLMMNKKYGKKQNESVVWSANACMINRVKVSFKIITIRIDPSNLKKMGK